jgi:hypothetical protein
MNHAEHLAWAKVRALDLLSQGDIEGALSSFMSDLAKHEGLRSHPVNDLIAMHMAAGLVTPVNARSLIEGTN